MKVSIYLRGGQVIDLPDCKVTVTRDTSTGKYTKIEWATLKDNVKTYLVSINPEEISAVTESVS